MRDFFNLDNPFMIFMADMTDVIILNVVCLICCLPIITIGPAITALHYVTLKMAKDEEGYVLKDFFKSFKENLKQSTIIWLLFLAITLFFYFDIKIIQEGPLPVPTFVKNIIYASYLLCCTTIMYTFPVLARFSNSISKTIKNAFLMSMIHIVRTIIMAIIYLIPVVLIPLNYNFIAVFLLVGLAGPAYLNGHIWKGIFKRYEPEEIRAEETEESII